jgi:hypothetical protein
LIVLAIFIKAIGPNGLRHAVRAVDIDLGDTELPSGLLHPIAVDRMALIDLARFHEKVGIELGNILTGYRIDLWIAEGIRSPRESDHERLIGKIDSDHRKAKSPFWLERRVCPIVARDGAIILPGHEILVLDLLRIDRWKDSASSLSLLVWYRG